MKVFDFTIKKSIILAGALLCSLSLLRGQNLVVNPGFELPRDSNTLIPPGEFHIAKALGWSVPTRAQATLYNSIPTLATTNRSLSKWKFTAKEGNSVVGIMTYGIVSGDETKELREYIQGSLAKPLVVGKKYYVSYWVHFHCEGTNNIGVAFTIKPVSVNSVARLDIKPQVNNANVVNYKSGSDWVLVRDSFIAKEPYKHFVIGNFFSNQETQVQSNKYHYHKAYFDEIVVEDAATAKILPPASDNTLANNTKNGGTQNNSTSKETVNSSTKTFESITTNVIQPNDKMSIPEMGPKRSTNNAIKGDVLVLDKVYFHIGSSRLKSESTTQLDKLLIYLQQNEAVDILVKGHTSSDGSDEFNLKLSQNRAKAVVDYLTSKGINTKRLSFKGFGETQPLQSNDTEEGRQKNRRVEFEIVE